jgi:hypothetical protein
MLLSDICTLSNCFARLLVLALLTASFAARDEDFACGRDGYSTGSGTFAGAGIVGAAFCIALAAGLSGARSTGLAGAASSLSSASKSSS